MGANPRNRKPAATAAKASGGGGGGGGGDKHTKVAKATPAPMPLLKPAVAIFLGWLGGLGGFARALLSAQQQLYQEPAPRARSERQRRAGGSLCQRLTPGRSGAHAAAL